MQQCSRFKDVLRVRVQTLAAAEQLTVAVYLYKVLHAARVACVIMHRKRGELRNVNHS